MSKEKIVRHSFLVRAVHWLIALSGLLLLFSGLGQMPMYKRYFISSIPGLGWSSNYEATLVMHYIAAFIFGAAVLFHLIYHLRRREFGIVPKKGDMGESAKIIRAMIAKTPEPPSDKYLAEQRVAYAATGAVTLVLLLSGLIKVFKNFGWMETDTWLIDAATLVHTFATPLFLLFFFAHIAAMVIKVNRPLFWTMFSGKIDRAYVEHRHTKWNWKREQLR